MRPEHPPGAFLTIPVRKLYSLFRRREADIKAPAASQTAAPAQAPPGSDRSVQPIKLFVKLDPETLLRID